MRRNSLDPKRYRTTALQSYRAPKASPVRMRGGKIGGRKVVKSPDSGAAPFFFGKPRDLSRVGGVDCAVLDGLAEGGFEIAEGF